MSVEIGCPRALRIGLSNAMLPPIVIEQAIASRSPASNSRRATPEEMLEIHRQAWVA